jgi:hypothetical protein
VSSLPRRQDNLQKVLSWYFQMKSPDSVAATRMRWLGAAADDPGAQRTGESPVLFSISALAPFFDRPCGHNCHCWGGILRLSKRSGKALRLSRLSCSF